MSILVNVILIMNILIVNMFFNGSLTNLKNWSIFKFLCIKLHVPSTWGLVHDFYFWSTFNFNHKVVWVTAPLKHLTSITSEMCLVSIIVSAMIPGEIIRRYPCVLAFRIWKHHTANHISGNSKVSQTCPIVIRPIMQTEISSITYRWIFLYLHQHSCLQLF